MSLTRTVATNTAVQAMGKVVSTIVGVLIVGIMTRELGTAGFGAYSTANAFLQIFAIFLDLGLNVMIVQMLGERAGDTAYENRVVRGVFGLRFWSAIILITLAPFIALLVPSYSPETKLAMFAIWGSFFFTVLNQIVIGVQQRHLKMHVVAAAEVLGRVTLLAGLLVAAAKGWGLIPMVLMVSLAGLVNFLVNFLYTRRLAAFSIKPDFAFWKTTLKRSWPIATTIVISLLYFKMDTLILSWVRPTDEVGIYSAAYRVLEILVAFPYMYAGVMLPIIANAWSRGQRERFVSIIARSLDMFAIIVVALVVGTELIAKDAMILVAGKDFAVSGDILQILVVAAGCIYMATIFNHAIVALDRQRQMVPIYAVVTAITLALYATFIPIYGMWAAAWLTIFSEAAIMIGGAWMTLKTTEMKLPLATFGKALVAAAAMAIVTIPVRGHLLLTIIIGAAAYLATLFLTGGLTKTMVSEMLLARKGTPSAGETVG
jgi:O-antigen/teichoic acid export membrane protein